MNILDECMAQYDVLLDKYWEAQWLIGKVHQELDNETWLFNELLGVDNET